MDFLGIIAHYLDEQYQPKSVLLGLLDTKGSHTSLSIKQHLCEVTYKEY